MYTLSDLKSEMRWLPESSLVERDLKKLRKDIVKLPLEKKASNNNQSKF